MPKFSDRSLEKLSTSHVDLQTIFNEIVKHFDCTILSGYRSEDDQNAAYRDGLSQMKYPNSMHNTSPSMGVDVIPYPVDWNDLHRIYYFAGYVKGMADNLYYNHKIDFKLRWGGDWDRDTEVKDNKFNDLVHFELVPNV